ncbi:adventurous gliding motility protein GltJ [Archangium violaceum]|uniref:adventurous gliding motility protein GltJ n=1 Tax=Archangium violaceum TaxID=83451 RepID=UPI0019512E16|nr:adventurous gliding motility protein GltJ [Archangium violaceum]QRO00989.1 adventurous gliding motility protein GltJ [Archangium violaceum]
MRFVCDSCRAQYMISDDKVGAKGVKVRCKKCGYNIVVRPAGSAPAKDEETEAANGNGTATSQGQSNNDSFGLPASLGTPPEGGIFSGVEDDELGAVFDQVLNSGSHRIPAGEAVGDGPAQLDASALSDAGETVRKLAEAEAGSAKPAAAHEWFVAIDEKQVGPLSLEKVKDHWEKGEVGPDSLCWRAGFSDWIPLSEASELASVLAPRPTKAVIVEPAPVASSSSAASGPVESAFSAGGPSKGAKANTPAPVGPSAQESGWKPSAASVLASLVKEENEALTKPAAKAPVEEKAKPVVSGLLDVPPPESAPVAAPSPMMAEPPAPASPYLPPPPAPAYAQPPPQAYAQPYAAPPGPQYAPPAGYPGYPPPAAQAPKQGGKMGLIIGVAVGVLLVGGGAGFYFATKSSGQTETPPATTQQAVAQAPATAQPKPADLPPMPPPPAAVAQNTAGTPAGAATQPATAQPATTPPPAPAVAAANPGTAPAANPPAPTQPAQTEPVKPSEPQQVARAEVPDRGGAKRGTARPASSRPASNDDDEETITASRGSTASKPAARPSGDADDEFDELFGTKKPGKTESASGRNAPTAYIPPEPGGGATLEKLGQSDIMQVVLANKPAIVKCVNEQKKKDPGLSGKLVMRWIIQTNGKTKNVSCQTSEFRSTYMATCISGLIKGWTFPKHKVQGDSIDFPFTF